MNLRKEILKSQTDLKIIDINKIRVITKAKFGPSKETQINFLLDENLSFYIATIIGDGHLKKAKLQIAIELSNKKLIDYIQKTCVKLFNRNFNIHPVKQRERKQLTYQMVMDSKSIYLLLNKVFEIPIGKKSNIVYVPKIIKKANKSIKSAFLIGIMLTEGGNRRRGIGMSTASEKLWKDLIQIFKEIGIKVFTDKWIYKKYNKEYYGFYFKKDKINLILKECKDIELNNLFKEHFGLG
ncbi:MAG: hypothetical protein AABW67_00945 [Nanoarchaeota archaeon]